MIRVIERQWTRIGKNRDRTRIVEQKKDTGHRAEGYQAREAQVSTKGTTTTRGYKKTSQLRTSAVCKKKKSRGGVWRKREDRQGGGGERNGNNFAKMGLKGVLTLGR